LSADLEERCQARLVILQRAAARRWLLQISGAVVGSVIALAIVATIVGHVRHQQQVTAFVETLSELIRRHQFEQAETLVRGAPQSVKEEPDAQKLLADWEEARKKEETRQREFAGRLNSANYKLAEAQKSLASDPGQTVLNRLYDEQEGIQKDLEQARALAQTDADRAGLARVADSASQARDQWQQQIDKAFLSQYDAFDKQLTQIENDKYADFETRKAKLGECKESVQKWEREGEHVTPALLSRTNTLRERIAGLEKVIHEGEQEDRDAKEITVALGDVSGYVKALQQYVERNPHTQRTADFKRTIEESLCWQAFADWNKVTKQWHQTGIVGLRPAAAQEQLAGAKAASDTFADCPECAGLVELLPYVKAVAARDNGGERIEVSLKKLFEDPLVANVWMVEINDGRRYYAPTEPALPELKYIIDFEGKTRGRLLTPLESQGVKYTGLAPQVAVAKQVQSILKALNDANWETSFCDMIAVIRADRAMDPILKTNLLKKVLECGAGGSYCLEKAFGRHLEWFKGAKIDASANWLDPKDAGVTEARNEAAKKLADFPDVDEPRNAVKQDLAAVQQRRLTEYMWIGWLHRGGEASWDCLTSGVPERSGTLWVIYRQSPGGKPLLATVGRFDRDRRTPTIHVQRESVLLEGRPVYLASP
jgi:hypothetical protein